MAEPIPTPTRKASEPPLPVPANEPRMTSPTSPAAAAPTAVYQSPVDEFKSPQSPLSAPPMSQSSSVEVGSLCSSSILTSR